MEDSKTIDGVTLPVLEADFDCRQYGDSLSDFIRSHPVAWQNMKSRCRSKGNIVRPLANIDLFNGDMSIPLLPSHIRQEMKVGLAGKLGLSGYLDIARKTLEVGVAAVPGSIAEFEWVLVKSKPNYDAAILNSALGIPTGLQLGASVEFVDGISPRQVGPMTDELKEHIYGGAARAVEATYEIDGISWRTTDYKPANFIVEPDFISREEGIATYLDPAGFVLVDVDPVLEYLVVGNKGTVYG